MTNHTMNRTDEITRSTWSGYPVGAVGLAVIAAGIWAIAHAGDAGGPPLLPAALVVAGAFLLSGIYVLQPNTAAILLLFGHYKGTDRGQGLRWANPFYRKQRISLRAHNLASDKLKVNDKRGNPIEIASAIGNLMLPVSNRFFVNHDSLGCREGRERFEGLILEAVTVS